MRSMGFSFLYPMFMSMFIYAGSMEFVTANLLLSAFNPLSAFLLALMVNARHLFYGISMLDKYQNVGWKKFYLIYGMCDETFSVNCTTEVPEGVDKRMVYVFCDAFEPDLLGGRCNRRGTAWHNGDTVSAVFNFPGRKRTTGIYPISG